MRHVTALLLAPLLSTVLAAQKGFEPAPELARFDRLLGDFEGSGQVWSGPDAPPNEWTATIRCAVVLGGHFVRQDEVIDLGDMAPAKLVFHTFYGYDRQHRRWVSYSVNNIGDVAEAEVHWQGDDTFLTTAAGSRQGRPLLERWTIAFTGDGFAIHGMEAIGNGPFHDHVRGSFRRVEAVADFAVADAAFVPGSLPEPMQRLQKVAGSYTVKGKHAMAPGTPMMDISGTHTMRPILGGTVFESVVDGDPGPMGKYEGWGAYGWDAANRRYVSIWLDNMGMCGAGASVWDGHDLITTLSRTAPGLAMVERSVLHCDDRGAVTRLTNHLIMGTADPFLGFDAKYVVQ